MFLREQNGVLMGYVSLGNTTNLRIFEKYKSENSKSLSLLERKKGKMRNLMLELVGLIILFLKFTHLELCFQTENNEEPKTIIEKLDKPKYASTFAPFIDQF